MQISVSVKDYGSQLGGLEQVKEGGHILFTPLTLFGRDFGGYMVKAGKRGEAIMETMTSPRLKVIDIDNI